MRKANMRHNMFPTMLGFASNYMRKHWLSINYLSIITTVILGFPTHMNESIISFILFCLQIFKCTNSLKWRIELSAQKFIFRNVLD